MTRLTLFEQVNVQASQIAELTAQLRTAHNDAALAHTGLEVQIAETQRLIKLADTIPALNEQVTKLTKERDDAKSSWAYRSGEYDKAAAEIEQTHAVLDGVEGAPSREYEVGDGYGSKRYHNVVTRLACAFLAIAKNGGAK